MLTFYKDNDIEGGARKSETSEKQEKTYLYTSPGKADREVASVFKQETQTAGEIETPSFKDPGCSSLRRQLSNEVLSSLSRFNCPSRFVEQGY